MSQDRCSHQLCQYLYRGLVALLQVEVNAHHPPPPIAYDAKYLCVVGQLSGSHSPSPVSTATFIYPGRQAALRAHPLIQWTE